MSDPKHMYWDSCVFYRYLTNVPIEYVDDIHRLMQDAQKGQRVIYCSTIVLAEVRHFALKKTQHRSIQQFFQAMTKAVILIDPNPNIMVCAGELKDAEAVNPSDKKTENRRVMGTADAIHLATCLYVRDAMKVADVVFHTFDNGKGKTWEGKCVPLLSMERWYPAAKRSPRLKEVCGLTRIIPEHPEQQLFSGKKAGNGATANP